MKNLFTKEGNKRAQTNNWQEELKYKVEFKLVTRSQSTKIQQKNSKRELPTNNYMVVTFDVTYSPVDKSFI